MQGKPVVTLVCLVRREIRTDAMLSPARARSRRNFHVPMVTDPVFLHAVGALVAALAPEVDTVAALQCTFTVRHCIPLPPALRLGGRFEISSGTGCLLLQARDKRRVLGAGEALLQDLHDGDEVVAKKGGSV